MTDTAAEEREGLACQWPQAAELDPTSHRSHNWFRTELTVCWLCAHHKTNGSVRTENAAAEPLQKRARLTELPLRIDLHFYFILFFAGGQGKDGISNT